MTMRPRLPLAMMRRSTARASSSGAVRFVSMIFAICSGDVCTCRLSWPMAALLTRASIGPRRLSASLRKAVMALTSVTSTDAATTRSGLAAATASSSGVTVRAKAATLAPCARMSSTMARPSPREPPETTTTVAGPMGSVLSDIALQGLLDRDVVEEPHPTGHGVVREASRAPRGQLGIARLAGEHDVGGHDAADDRGLAAAHGGPGHRGVCLQHVAHGGGGRLRSPDVDLVGRDAAGDEDAAVDHLDAVTGAEHPVDALAPLG